MKSSKKVVIISVVFIIMVICSFCIFSFKSNNTKIDKILRSSSYSYFLAAELCVCVCLHVCVEVGKTSYLSTYADQMSLCPQEFVHVSVPWIVFLKD